MHRQRGILITVALLGSVLAQEAQITAAPGTIAKRQEDSRPIELHQDYAAPVGVDTQYLSVEGSTTKWVGVNTEYLSEEVRTTTIDNQETSTTVKVQVAAVTATESSDGVNVGDVTVLLSDAVQNEVNSIVQEAASACAGAAKLRKRDPLCMIDFLQSSAQSEGTLSLVNPADWEAFLIKAADSAPAILNAAFAVLKSQLEKNKFAVLVAAAGTAGVLTLAGEATEPQEVAHKFVFADGAVGHGKQDDDTTSTSTGCDPSKPTEINENSPACDDDDCKGEDGKLCKVDGSNKDCACAYWTEEIVEGHFDKDWSDEQQKILQDLQNGLPDVLPPQCILNTHGDGFDGSPRAEPSAWCYCWEDGATSATFATMSGEGDDACTYTAMPTETISVSLKDSESTVTACRLETASDDVYCTCNDNKQHGVSKTTRDGTEVTQCPAATSSIGDPDHIPERPESGWEWYAWSASDCDDVKTWDRMSSSGRAEDQGDDFLFPCKSNFYPPSTGQVYFNCAAGNVEKEEWRLCFYSEPECKGAAAEIRRDDVKTPKIEWLDDGGGSPRPLRSWSVKKTSC